MRKLIALGFLLLVVGDVAATPTPTPRPTPSATPTPTPGPTGAVFYAAPNGSPSGNGSISWPWDIQTALNQPAVVTCGARIYVRGGTVVGKFVGRLRGCADNNRIVFQSAPGEWFRIDGYQKTTLAVALPAGRFTNQWEQVRFASDVGFYDGSTVLIGTEQLYLGRKLANGVTWEVIRGNSGTAVVAHAAGDVVHSEGDALTLEGQFADYKDFEVFSSNRERNFTFSWGGLAPIVRGGGINSTQSLGLRLDNVVVHDVGVAVGANTGAIDFQCNSCVLYNNGFTDLGRGHGQGYYWLNQFGLKQLKAGFNFNNFGGSKFYSESGYAQNFLAQRQIAFNEGATSAFPGNMGGGNGQPLPLSHRYSNFFAGTGNRNNPISDLTISECAFYHPPDALVEGGNLGLGYQAGNAERLRVEDTQIIGGNNAIELKGFKSITSFQGNTIYAQNSGPWSTTQWQMLVKASLEPGFTANWDRNNYFELLPLYEGRTSYPFQFAVGAQQVEACDGGAALKWDAICAPPKGGWRQLTRFDTTSTYLHRAPPNKSVVIPTSSPNRWNIAIYNFEQRATVTVTVAGLREGDRYDLFAVEEGRYPTGAPTTSGVAAANGQVVVPMAPGPVAGPIGLNWSPASTRPLFGAFILIRKP